MTVSWRFSVVCSKRFPGGLFHPCIYLLGENPRHPSVDLILIGASRQHLDSHLILAVLWVLYPVVNLIHLQLVVQLPLIVILVNQSSLTDISLVVIKYSVLIAVVCSR